MFQEYKRLKLKPERVASVFKEVAINEQGEEVKNSDAPSVVARMKYYDRYPVLEIFSREVVTTARIKAYMTTPEFVRFHITCKQNVIVLLMLLTKMYHFYCKFNH